MLIATPDHHHATAAVRAMERGKHVYVQKPLTHTIEEARKLAARRAANPKVATQMGNQGYSGNDGTGVAEMIRGGVIGKVSEVHVWTNRPVWPQGVPKPRGRRPPARLDWRRGWVRRTSTGATTPTTRPSTGAAGCRSAPARWATWAPT